MVGGCRKDGSIRAVGNVIGMVVATVNAALSVLVTALPLLLCPFTVVLLVVNQLNQSLESTQLVQHLDRTLVGDWNLCW